MSALRETFEPLRQRAKAKWQALMVSPQPKLFIGTATCGRAAGALEVWAAAEEWLKNTQLQASLIPVGCIGLCYAEPLLDIQKPERPRLAFRCTSAGEVGQLLGDYLVRDRIHRETALGTLGDGDIQGVGRFFDLPMLKPQVRVVLRNCGFINPEDIDHYIAQDGYLGFLRALETTPLEVTEEVKASGLRGRGGAGFPTGQKWEFCRSSPGPVKYLICNADEGDPGAFMNRSLLEGDPHAVLEGMLIAGYAIGASTGYIYCRAEYPLALERIRTALKQMAQYGLLGESILGSGFGFNILVREGAGAFVCGEETALMASVEGKRGMPRPRPPFPAVRGLWGKPTNINNVETLGTLPNILRHGAQWYAQHGTERCRGTKTFSLVGKVARAGLVEVPLGTKLGEVIYEIGGGISGGKAFKAVQSGGPSGGSLPGSALDLPLDYEALAAAGAIMGSGGLIVMDEDNCPVDLARFFLTFTQKESCGKCPSCRVGTRQMLAILERISNGKAETGDLDRLSTLAGTVRDTSLCGLGQTAPNPVLTTLRYFREEYEEHIKKHLCRAAVCRGLVKAPCHHLCPAGIDVPRYVRLCAQGKFIEALAVNREKVPFPGVLGRVCTHPCETRCTRGKLEEPIAIRALKRIATEHDPGAGYFRGYMAPATGKSVAVVGSGPAGLTAAYYLAKLGHRVTVFEALSQPGGMMRTGIPIYRLPREILDREIEEIKGVGVEIRTNSPVSSLDSLFEQGYSAVFLAIGAHSAAKMGIEGEELAWEAVTFLRQVNLGQAVSVGSRVAVVGGGNAAIDAARTALRLGAKEVTILYRRTRQEMPAIPEEIAEAEEEGVKFQFLTAPTKITPEAGGLRLTCVHMKLGAFDAGGRRRPEPIPGSETPGDFDTVILAVGQLPLVPPSLGLTLGQGNIFEVEPDSLTTPRPGVFAGGDCVTGPATVIEAIAAGRRAAASIDRFLGGRGEIDEVLLPREEGATATFVVDEGEKPRVPIAVLHPEQRQGFLATELGYKPEGAKEEAQRCLNCDLEQNLESS